MLVRFRDLNPTPKKAPVDSGGFFHAPRQTIASNHDRWLLAFTAPQRYAGVVF